MRAQRSAHFRTGMSPTGDGQGSLSVPFHNATCDVGADSARLRDFNLPPFQTWVNPVSGSYGQRRSGDFHANPRRTFTRQAARRGELSPDYGNHLGGAVRGVVVEIVFPGHRRWTFLGRKGKWPDSGERIVDVVTRESHPGKQVEERAQQIVNLVRRRLHLAG